jgi:hypothetical protein
MPYEIQIKSVNLTQYALDMNAYVQFILLQLIEI